MSLATIILLETPAGGCFRVASCPLSPLLCARPGVIGVGYVRDAERLEDIAVPISLAPKLEPIKPGAERRLDFRSDGGLHPQAGEAEPPVDAIDAQVSGLDGGGHVRGHEKGRRD